MYRIPVIDIYIFFSFLNQFSLLLFEFSVLTPSLAYLHLIHDLTIFNTLLESKICTNLLIYPLTTRNFITWAYFRIFLTKNFNE